MRVMVGRVGEMVTGMGRMEGSGKKLKVATDRTSWIAGRSGLTRGCFWGRCGARLGSSCGGLVSGIVLGSGESGNRCGVVTWVVVLGVVGLVGGG